MFKDNRKAIYFVYIVFGIISVLSVGSTGSTLALMHGQTPFFIVFKQVLFLVFGFLLMKLVSRVNYAIYLNLAEFFYFFSLFLLLVTMIYGKSINATKRWLEIPVLGLQFQTSDFAKIALVFIVAQILSSTKDLYARTKEVLLKIALYAAFPVGIIMINDNSTAFLIVAVIIVLLFLSPINKNLLIKYLALLGGVFVFAFLILSATGVGRMDTMFSRMIHFISGNDYSQSLQAKIAIATGNWLIPAPGTSELKYALSHSYSDFLYAIICEELGLIISFTVIVLYVFLLYHTGEIVKKQQKSFPVYVAIGLVLNIVLQAFTHIAVNIGLFPVTGQPLPLISLGGTSIFITSFALGVILNIAEAPDRVSEETKNINDDNESEDFNFDIKNEIIFE